MTTIDIPDDSLFGLDNLPYGVFSTATTPPRVGVRVADTIIDLARALNDDVFAHPSLNPFMAQGRSRWTEVRQQVSALAAGDVADDALADVAHTTMHLPIEVADYVDFYASEHHATNLGRLFRPDSEPLMPNWKHLPVGYHGRSSTIVVSGTDIVRPRGQRKIAGDDQPSFGPSVRLDIEAELGFIIGVGSPMNSPISPDEFTDHCFGVVLLNDWSARDIQAWEYVPLGPNLGKSFATSISPWVVTLDALESARVATPTQTPAPLPYLQGNQKWGLDIDLAVEWNGDVVSHPPYREMYWSPAQMLAHTTVNGAAARTGDLFGSGTISGPDRDQRGAFIELTWGGAEPIAVDGHKRTFLEDGDTVSITASALGIGGGRIGFGEVRGTISASAPTESGPTR
ncbi:MULTISPECIES: fumarylacetoacetase [unclassified Gordonia (in: high G+C Gram-positive bacteria)]|uniref:fumarylacetoacetase n=1 Tax=unclassified Gordonia (in: high G+C Gram-positive bacteria) TaxID=2657482 RepID=UPI0007EB26F9|nr:MULTISPECIES: fumarylacetoacetase [unclassified Gordonia (in: high G+C Gram-positive bacteria)]OBB99647.1 fumarylacetoacetase [Gordonia sp. 852002-50395_SCH5434458]OBC13880.1 fumarylacetoacetase [Gordonia sp. 852002-50816_SCH5313054-c]OBC16188.1 fumarylacetoacetase [Gordonia sp. 852002-50816_SCH5313054-a]